jgi:sulfocyanin
LKTHIGHFVIPALLLGAIPLAGQSPAKVDPSWMTVRAADSTVEFRAVAGLTPANSGMNFDGAGTGGLTLTVPVGWHVILHFANNDENMPHSLIVTKFENPVPVTPSVAAFAGAASKDASQGVGVGSKQDLRFKANQAGSYLIICGVPGHGAAGMWIKLTVSASAPKPAVASGP